MKRNLIFALLCVCSLLVFGQDKAKSDREIQMHYGRSSCAIKGGEEGKMYVAIIKSGHSMKEVVATTVKFLDQYGFVNAKEVKINEIDESASEYVVPFCFVQTVFHASMREMLPVALFGNLRFAFNDDGSVMIVVQDLKSDYLAVKTSKQSNKAAYDKFVEELVISNIANSFMSKVVVWANTSPEERKNFYKKAHEYLSSEVDRINVYNAMVQAGDAWWMDAASILAYLETHSMPGGNYKAKWVKSSVIPEERLIEISEKRWDKQVRRNFDTIFKMLAELLEGEIIGIQEDGTLTWTVVDGLLVPTNPKQQKKYLKEKKSFYDVE